MKKILLAAVTLISLMAISQEADTWRIGVQWGFQGNRSHFAGGMPNANARFYENKFDGTAFNINGRYDLNDHWMGTFGLGFSTFGFQYALAEHYSLTNPKSHFSNLTSEFSALELPLMIFYKFKPNCKNAKWLVGGGFSQNFIGAQTVTRNLYPEIDCATCVSSLPNDMTSVSSTSGGGYTMLRFAVAREKVFKKGGILNASLIFNAGFKQLATSTVNYTVDGQTYNHDFKTKGNFAGFRLTWFFRPLKSKPATRPAKTVKS